MRKSINILDPRKSGGTGAKPPKKIGFLALKFTEIRHVRKGLLYNDLLKIIKNRSIFRLVKNKGGI